MSELWEVEWGEEDGPEIPDIIQNSTVTGSASPATKRPASTTRGASQGAEPTREAEEEVTEPTAQEILGDKFIVVPVAATRALAQVWGTSPVIDEYAGAHEGVWWPSGVWTSRHRPEDGQTPPKTRRVILRPARDILAVAASYDTQEDGERTWVLAMDTDGDPIGVWCLPHEAGKKFLTAFTAPRWTESPVEEESDDEPDIEPPAAPEEPEHVAVASAEPSWGEEFPPEPDFDW